MEQTEAEEQNEQLYRTALRLDADAREIVESIRDAIFEREVPAPVKRAEGTEIIVHPGIQIEGEMGSDLRKMLEFSQSNWTGERAQNELEPARIHVQPGDDLVDYVAIDFHNGMEMTRMSQAAEVVKHGGENVLYPKTTEIVLAYVDEDVDGALGPFERVAQDDPNGVNKWFDGLDIEPLEDMLPDKMGLDENIVEERKKPISWD